MEPRTCVHLGLALWLEEWLEFGAGNQAQWLFIEAKTMMNSAADLQDKEAEAGKAKCQRKLKALVDSPCFESEDDKRLGTHSIRKSAATRH